MREEIDQLDMDLGALVGEGSEFVPFDRRMLKKYIQQEITKAQSEVLQAVREKGPKDSRGNPNDHYINGVNATNHCWHTAINTVARERGLS